MRPVAMAVMMLGMMPLVGNCASNQVAVTTVIRPLPGRAAGIAVNDAGEMLITADHSVYHGHRNGSFELTAGSGNSTTGDLDGVGTDARFSYPYGITWHEVANEVYICDCANNRIRKLGLPSLNVTTVAGSAQGFTDGVGVAVQFNNPVGNALFVPAGLLYVADYLNYAVRRIELATANVTTIATTPAECFCLCITRNGSFLYVTTYVAVVKIDTSTNVSTTVAGASIAGHQDGVGAAAMFNRPNGIALNTDETALVVADQLNYVIRRVDLPTGGVTTIAGNGTVGFADGPGRDAMFSVLVDATWYCDVPSNLCGALVGDLDNNAVRFVEVEGPTVTASISALRTSSEGLSATASTTQPTSSRSTRRFDTSSYATVSVGTTQRSHSLLQSNSYSRSLTKSWPSRSPSASTTRKSASRTTYCALLPRDDLGGALAALHSFTASVVDGAGAVTPVALVGAQLSNVTGELVSAVASEAIGRQALLGRYPLAASLSLTLGGTLRGVDDPADGWALVGVQLDVVAVDATFPLLTAAAGFTVVSSSVAGRQQLLACVLYPPSATGWLPSALGVLSTVTLRLRLTLRCPTGAAATQDVVIVVPSPGQPAVLTAEVSAASTAAQYSSWVASPSTGTGVGRLSAVRGFVACDGSGAIGGLLPLPVAADCEDDASASSDAADARGAVLGNLVLWAAGCALMGLLTCGYSRCAAVPLITAAEALGVPSPLLPLVATVPSTASSTFVLLRSLCAADRAVAAVGFLMILCPIAVLCGLSLLVPQLLHLGAHEAHWSPGGFAAARAVVARLLHRRVRWCCRALSGGPDPAARPLRLERVATVVLLEYAVVWYLCVDVAVLTAAGLLGAASTLGSLAACRGSAVAVAVLYAGQLVLCAAVRPYTTLFSHVHTLFCLALGAVSVWCQVWYLFASARDGADLDALGALLAVSAVCDIAVSAASMLRTLTDVVEALRACRRHLVVLWLCSPVVPTVVARSDAAQPWLPRLPQMNAGVGRDQLDDCCGEVIAGDYCQGALKWEGGDDDATFLEIDESGATIAAGVGSTDAVGIVTAREEMAQKHRGAAHDLLLHFDTAVTCFADD